MIQGTHMSQAEIASGQITPQDELPAKGRRLHDFELTSADGRSFHLYEQRARSNLVLVLADDRLATTELLSEMAARHEEFTNEEAEIIPDTRWPNPLDSRRDPRLAGVYQQPVPGVRAARVATLTAIAELPVGMP